jgi:hypothetical protein
VTTTSRGYGYAHRRERERWRPLVASGYVTCWRCGNLIQPGTQWDLGHDDEDRTIIRGPEHARECNRAAAGRKARANDRTRHRAIPHNTVTNRSDAW